MLPKKKVGLCVLGLLAAAAILLPVTGRAASKVTMPKKVTQSDKYPDRDSYLKTTVSTISYDKSGRIKKIGMYSDITEVSWYYAFSYKKSGKKTMVTSTCHDNEGTSRDKFTFGANGLLQSSTRDGSCTWNYYDKKKTKPVMLQIGKKEAYIFTKKGLPEMYIYLEKSKYKSVLAYTVKSGKITGATGFDLSKPVAELTEAALDKAEVTQHKYATSTTKVSMSSAVRWMNWALLLEYVY